MKTVFMDIETRSKLDLRKTGVLKYFSDQTTSPICIVWKSEGLSYGWSCQPIEVPGIATFCCPLSKAIKFIETITQDATWVAHNGNGFDRVFWESTGLPQPEHGWNDTLHLARLYGLPGGLERVAAELVGEHKLAEEQKIMKKWMKKPGVRIPDEDLQQIITYCHQDVELLDKIYHLMEPMAGFEKELREVDYAINRRGFYVNLELVARLTLAALSKRSEALAKIEQHGLDLRQLRSPVALKEWYRSQGHDINDVQKNTIKDLLGEAEKDVFAAREQASRASFGKYKYMLDGEVGSRVHFQISYHGAHTGRWTAKGLQVHNLPRGVLKEPEIEAAIANPEGIEFGTRNVGDVFSSLVRSCIQAPPGSKGLLIRDYSSIEVRGVHWCAGDKVRLAQHERGEDPYINFVLEAYNKIINKKDPLRQGNKPVVLGCGYGMGAEKLLGYAKGMNIDLSITGKTPEELVEMYRKTHPLEAGVYEEGRYQGGLWRNLERACRGALKFGNKSIVGHCRIYRDGGCLVIILPSGRPQIYRQAHLRKTMAPWGQTDSIYYKNPKGYWDDIYGGKLTENIVQAICRDIFAEALVRCERIGLKVVLHVHDEIIVESWSDEDEERMIEAMNTRPKWAEDFPIYTEGFRSDYFRKG